MRKLFSYSELSNNFIPKNNWKAFLKSAIKKTIRDVFQNIIRQA